MRLGVIGLGRAFTLMLPTFLRDPRVRLVAASDPRPDSRARFAADFAAQAYETAEALCADPEVQAVYVASPHQFHLEHVRLAAAHGKHALVEKPMALTLADCDAMIRAAADGGVHLLVGHSHSFDLSYLRTRELIAEGCYGAVRMITALNYTDFLYRPRRPEELDTAQGGGVVFSQAAHQVDVVRLLAGRPATSLRAVTGVWDPGRPTEGAYNAQLRFGPETVASLTYSGYGRFDSDELTGWVGELGQAKDPAVYGEARRRLRAATSPEEEAAQKVRRTYGSSGRAAFDARPPSRNHFGFVLVSCEGADLRPMPDGIVVYGDEERRLIPLPPPEVPRSEVIDELFAAVFDDRPPLHSGAWGLATMEICLGLLGSSASVGDVALSRQI